MSSNGSRPQLRQSVGKAGRRQPEPVPAVVLCDPLALDRVSGARHGYGAYHLDQQRRRVLKLLAARWEAAPRLPPITLGLDPRPEAVLPPADLLRPPDGKEGRFLWDCV